MIRLKPKLLLIDDDPRYVRSLRPVLEDAGFDVLVAYNGKEGLRMAFHERPDLILLDIMMAGMDGFEALDHLEAVTDIPVMMITGSATQDHYEIRSLNKGAVDFVRKGMSNELLIAKIKNRLRARESRQVLHGSLVIDDCLEVDLNRDLVRVEGQEVKLTPKQSRIFRLLLEKQGRVVTVDELLRAGWDDLDFHDPSVVKIQISTLRRKLGDSSRNPRYIHTIRERGYMFDPHCG